MNIFSIWAILITPYSAYSLARYLIIRIPIWWKKWIKGECRYLCIKCSQFDICKYEMNLKPEYQRGFNEGYEKGLIDGTNNRH